MENRDEVVYHCINLNTNEKYIVKDNSWYGETIQKHINEMLEKTANNFIWSTSKNQLRILNIAHSLNKMKFGKNEF